MARSRLADLVRSVLRQAVSPTHAPSAAPGPVGTAPGPVGPAVAYAPDLDGAPDPGEIVWAWVTYDDDPSQGKDRPVLLVGRDGATLLGLQLSSQDHDLDAADEARYGRYWMDIGSGAWDSQNRASEVRLDRLLRLEESDVRREGAVLSRDMFDAVVREVRTRHHL
jgi:hypothetical protein